MNMTHPRSAFGATPSRGRHRWPGQAGSTVAPGNTASIPSRMKALERTPPIATKFPTMGTTIFTVMSALATETNAVNLGQGFPDFE